MKTMDEAVKKTQETARDVEDATKKVEAHGNGLKNFAQSVLSALGAIGVKNWLKEGLHGFAEAEGISIRLTAALESNGRQVAETREEYETFAAELERTTRQEDDATLANLAMAESFGLTGEAAKKAVKDAISLAAVNDGNAQSYLRFTAAMARGDTELAMGMAKMIPQLRGEKNEVEFLAKAAKLLETGWKTEQELTKTVSGQLQILKRDYGNLLEEFGKFTAQGVKPLISGLSGLVDLLKMLPDWTKAVAVGLALLAAAALSATAAWKTMVMLGIPAMFVQVKAGIATAVTWLGTYSIALNAATVATKLLNAASMAAPWVVLAGVVAMAIYKIQQVKREYKDLQDQLAGKVTAKAEREFEKIQSETAGMGDRDRIAYLKEQARLLEQARINAAGASPKNPEFLKREAIASAAEQAKKKVDDLIASLESPTLTIKATESVKEYTDGLRLQAATVGMTEQEVARYKLTLLATNDAQREALNAALAEADAYAALIEVEKAEAQAKKDMEEADLALAESFDEVTHSLDMQINKLRMTTDEYERLRLAEQGFSAEQIDYIRFQQEWLANLEEENKLTDEKVEKMREVEAQSRAAAQAGSAEALARVTAYADLINARGTDGASAGGVLGRAGGAGAQADAVARRQDEKNTQLLTQIRDLLRSRQDNALVLAAADLGGD